MVDCIHLGERECSIQRRHQKLIRGSAFAGAVTPELRERMGTAAVEACKRIGYSSAGTVEFLLDEDDQFYFMEMNTRIQVEHPVTEMVTLADIVRNQIRIAEGERSVLTSRIDVLFVGHAIECRINAEDPGRSPLRPVSSPPSICRAAPACGLTRQSIRAIVVPPFYDSMIAKLIVHARTRDLAIARMRSRARSYGDRGNQDDDTAASHIMEDPYFRAGEYSTRSWRNLRASEDAEGEGFAASGAV